MTPPISIDINSAESIAAARVALAQTKQKVDLTQTTAVDAEPEQETAVAVAEPENNQTVSAVIDPKAQPEPMPSTIGPI
jgi:hypothetical protein